MSAAVLDMSVSLDGFIAGPSDDDDNPLGVDGHRLHEWLWEGGGDPDPASGIPARPPGVNGERLDELEVHQIPVLLGQGRRLFEHLGPGHIELELTRIVDGPGVTHLRYRVRRSEVER